MKKTHNYVDNKKFYSSIVEFRREKQLAIENNTEEPRMPEYIGKCIYLIAKNLTNHRWFIGYTEVYKEEMVSDAIEKCILYFDKFDYEKWNNPFAYFSKVCYFTFQDRKKKERKEQYIKYKSFQNKMISGEIPTNTDDNNNLTGSTMYDNIGEFIEKFESDEDVLREKRRKKVREKKLLKAEEGDSDDEE